MAEPLTETEEKVYDLVAREGPINAVQIEKLLGYNNKNRPGGSARRILVNIQKKGYPIKRFKYGSSRNHDYSLDGGVEPEVVRNKSFDVDSEFEVNKRHDDTWYIITTKNFKTPEEAMAYAGMDPTVWMCTKVVTMSNEWDVTAKTEDGFDTHTNKQTKLKFTFERKIPIAVDDGISMFLKNRIKSPKFKKIKRKPPKDPHMLEISMPDAHFGMMAWEEECGENYDSKIASKLFVEAGKTLLNRSAGYNIDQIVIPIGNDLFHMNDITGLTPKKKNKLDVDNRIAKVFNYVLNAYTDLIAFCREYAPVSVIWVKGNHDPESSYYAAKTLEYYYKGEGAEDVVFDTAPEPQKHIVYGKNLVAWTHGDEEPHRDLPGVMLGKWPLDTGKALFREWHLGHFHKKKEMFSVLGDEMRAGVRIRIIPSLSAKDYWHTSKGYMSIRSAEAYLFSKDNGPSGNFAVNVFKNEILGKNLSCNR